MRHIQFKGKIKKTNQWVFGYYLKQLDHGEIMSEDHIIIDEDGLHYYVEASSVGQFTGLKDKNNKDIYEGDNVEIQGCNIWGESKGYTKYIKTIVFKDGIFGFLSQEGYVLNVRRLDEITIKEFEVVGNISD